VEYHLVGGLEHFLFFHSVGNVIIPTDFQSIIFQRGRLNHQPVINITHQNNPNGYPPAKLTHLCSYHHLLGEISPQLSLLDINQLLPSGKHTKNYGKSRLLTGKSTINGNFQ
jgi:hypothetical protein